MTYEWRCKGCGSKGEENFKEQGGKMYCIACGKILKPEQLFTDESIEKVKEIVGGYIAEKMDEEESEEYRGLLYRFNEEVNRDHPSKKELYEISGEILKKNPNDKFAQICREITSESRRDEQINLRLKEMTAELEECPDLYSDDYYKRVVEFMIKFMLKKNFNSLGSFIEKVTEGKSTKEWNATEKKFHNQKEVIDKGTYNFQKEKDVFIVHASEDYADALEVAELLQECNISYFLSEENLRHGFGEDYKVRIRNALDACKIILFISSEHSRDVERDTISLELDYVKKKDVERWERRPEYQDCNYKYIPEKYKKKRVEYLIQKYPPRRVSSIGEDEVKKFFGDLPWQESPIDVVNKIKELKRELLKRPEEFPRGEVLRKDVIVGEAALSKTKKIKSENYSKADKVKLNNEEKQKIALQRKQKREAAKQERTVKKQKKNEEKKLAIVEKQKKRQEQKLAKVIAKQNADAERQKKKPRRNLYSNELAFYGGIAGTGMFGGVGLILAIWVWSGWGSDTQVTSMFFASALLVSLIVLIIGAEEKDIAGIACAVVSAIGIACLVSSAVLFVRTTAKKFTYKVGEQGYAAVTDFNSEAWGDITIPSEIDGHTVVSVELSAFRNCYRVTGITIPASVTKVSMPSYTGALTGCDRLTKLTVEEGNPVYHSAGNCIIETETKTLIVGWKKSKIPADGSVTSIGSKSFYSCDKLKSIAIPNSIVSIGSSAFRDCIRLKQISIPSSVTEIGGSAFSGCKNLAGVELSKNITTINEAAFDACSSLKNVTIPNSVTEIGKNAFRGCNKLQTITIPSGVEKINESAFSECGGVKSILIPSSVTEIGSGAFSGAKKLETITVANNNPIYCSSGNCLVEIESKTLIAGCKNSEIPADGSVLEIGSAAFRSCSQLKSITIPNGVTVIGSSAFYGCSKLQRIVIPNSVTKINYEAFTDCGRITTVTIPNGVTSIGTEAFKNCGKLKSITIPSSVISIGTDAFSGCKKLLKKEKKVWYVDKWAVDCEDKATSVTLRENTVGIAGSAFRDCSSLTSITIPDSVTAIEYQAFYGCSSLTNVKIPDGVTTIGNSAFYACDGLTSIFVPQSVSRIGKGAFEKCNQLKEITLPFIGEQKSGSANTYLGYIFGAFSYYSNDTAVPPSLTTVTIANGITEIPTHSFYKCKNITSVTIPDSVTSIGSYAFDGCSSLMSVVIPDGVTSIGWAAFDDCSSLTDFYYQGTKAQWSAIKRGGSWDYNTGKYTVHCTDGDITK